MNFIKTYFPGLLLLLIFVTLGFCTYQDYGVGMDENDQRSIGLAYYSYVFENDTNFHHYIERDHGAGFELPLIIVEKQLKLIDSREIFLARHLITHLFFLGCMFFGYLMVYRLFNSQMLACLAFIMLTFHPRIYGHSFFNTKDIPAVATMVLSMAALSWAFEKRTRLPWMLCGLVCGYSASIRLMNIIVLAPIFLFFIADIIGNNDHQKRNYHIVNAGLFLAAFSVAIYCCWPTLWGNPIVNFIDAYQSFSHFRWQGNVLFCGDVINAGTLPWYYIITWFCITTPVVWLIAGFSGLLLSIRTIVKYPGSFFAGGKKRLIIFSLFCFLAPLIMVVMLHSVLYDDWRHLYFIYPAFVILALNAINSIQAYRKRFVAIVLILGQFAFLIVFTVRSYPYPHLYFNELLSHKKDALQQSFELDYWGTSCGAALEWILKHDASEKIMINRSKVLESNLQKLGLEKRNRFILSDDEAKLNYYIQPFRTDPYLYPASRSNYDIIVEHSSILRIARLH